MEALTYTNKERIRMHRDQQIIAAFGDLRRAYPDAPAARIIRTIAASGRFKLGEAGLKRVLYVNGIRTSKNA